MIIWGCKFFSVYYPHKKSIYRTISTRLQSKIQIYVDTTMRNSVNETLFLNYYDQFNVYEP